MEVCDAILDRRNAFALKFPGEHRSAETPGMIPAALGRLARGYLYLARNRSDHRDALLLQTWSPYEGWPTAAIVSDDARSLAIERSVFDRPLAEHLRLIAIGEGGGSEPAQKAWGGEG